MDPGAFTIEQRVDPLVLDAESDTLNIIPAVYPNAKSFLCFYPRGTYTCLRAHWRSHTIDSYQPLQFNFHLDRLKTGFLLSYDRKDSSQAIKFAEIALCTTKTLVERLLDFCALSRIPPAPMLLLTILWSYDTKALDKNLLIAIHVNRMPGISPHQKMETRHYALVYGQPRVLPACKDSSWIFTRRQIEEYKQEMQKKLSDGILTEVVLVDKAKEAGAPRLLEGLITNFFVVQDGQVWTAEEGILHGSMRQLVIEACAALQIPIIQESPSYNDRKLWQAAFLTSVVRVVSPIDVILWDPSVFTDKESTKENPGHSSDWEQTELSRQETKHSGELVAKIYNYIVSQLFETE